jgi:predicted deacetylase
MDPSVFPLPDRFFQDEERAKASHGQLSRRGYTIHIFIWPRFRLVKYYNLPRFIEKQFVRCDLTTIYKAYKHQTSGDILDTFSLIDEYICR